MQPCACTGSCAYVHVSCLGHWAVEAGSLRCELCSSVYVEPWRTELELAMPPPQPLPQPRRFVTPEGQSVVIIPLGVGLGPSPLTPGNMGPLIQQVQRGGGSAVVASPHVIEAQAEASELCQVGRP